MASAQPEAKDADPPEAAKPKAAVPASSMFCGVPKLLFASNFAVLADSYANTTVALAAPFAITATFHGQKSDLGLMLSLEAFVQSFSMMLFARLSDSMSHSLILVLMNVGTAAGALLAGSATTVFQANVAFAVLGFFGASQPINRALITLTVPEKDRTMAFGQTGLFLQIATVLSMLAVGLADAIGLSYSAIMYMGAIPGLVALVLTLMAMNDAKPPPAAVAAEGGGDGGGGGGGGGGGDGAAAAGKPTSAPAASEGAGGWTWPITFQMIMFFLFHLASTGQVSVNAFTMQQVLGAELGLVSIIILVFIVECGLFTVTLLQPISSRFGPRHSCAIGAVSLAVGSLQTAGLASSGWRAWPLFGLALTTTAFGTVILGANLFTVFTAILPKGQEGSYIGINSTVGALARAIAPAVGVYLFVYVHWWMPYVCGAAISAAMAVLYLVVDHGDGSKKANDAGALL